MQRVDLLSNVTECVIFMTIINVITKQLYLLQYSFLGKLHPGEHAVPSLEK